MAQLAEEAESADGTAEPRLGTSVPSEDSIGGLTSRPPSLPGQAAGQSSTAAVSVIQGSAALSTDAGMQMAAAAKARRRQQRAEELRMAALAPLTARTTQQVQYGVVIDPCMGHHTCMQVAG